MNGVRSRLRRGLAVVPVVFLLALGLGACGNGEDDVTAAAAAR